MLDTYRAEIDAIDEQLLSLLEARLAKVVQVGQYKKAHALAVKDAGREAALLANLSQKVAQPEHWEQIEPIFHRIIEVSRAEQAALPEVCAETLQTVAYFGQPGSYTQVAMKRYFKDEVNGQAASSFEAVAEAVVSGKCRYGVLPIENSSTGSIHAVYDLLGSLPISIVGEVRVKVEHYLLAAKGTARGAIQKVYSHPQALSQCQSYLAAAGYDSEAVSSTSHGAELAAAMSGVAAIGNKEAAKYYELEVLEGPLNDYGANQTRFIVIQSETEERSQTENKARVIGLSFMIPNACGALCGVLKIFEAQGLNLLKIESRPIGDRPFEYQFYMDFEGAIDAQAVQSALNALNGHTTWMKVLGEWEKPLTEA